MYRVIEQRVRAAADRLRSEAKHRRETTPSDVAAEAFDTSARIVEEAINEAMRETELLTPAAYAELHHVTQQTVTRWIRVGELAADETANGYLIARDAKRVERVRKAS
jgi:DNA-binding transcriptional regulator YiaG